MRIKIKNILTLIIIAIATTVSAQTDTTQNLYNQLIQQYNQYINTEPFYALELAAQAKQIAEKSNDSTLIAAAYKNIGFGYYKTRVYYLAIEAQFKAYEIYTNKQQNDKMALCQIDIARTYYAQEAYDLAEKYCSNAIEICRNYQYPNIQASALTLLGDITIKNDEDNALKNLIAAKKLYTDLEATEKILETNIKIAQAYAITNQPDSALEILDTCLELYQKNNNNFGIANTMETYAYVYIYDENPTKASQALQSAYQYFLKDNRTHEALVARTRLASMQIEYKMDEQAKNNAEAVLHDAELEEIKTGISELRIKNHACNILRLFYKKHGIYDKALLYSERYAQTSDSIFEQKKKEQLSEYQVSLESQKKQKEIEQIQYQAEREKFNLERKQSKRNIFFLIIVILLVVIVVLIYYFRYKEKNNHNKQLSESNNRMQIEIQERKLAEVELRNSEEKYRLLFRKTPIGIIQFNENFKITTANERIAQIFNLKNANIVGQDITTVIPAEILQGFDTNPEKKQSDKISKQEYEINTSNGIVYTSITLKPYFYNTGREIEKGGIMIVEDITNRKIAEQNASQLSQKQTSILSLLPESIFSIDQNGTFTYAQIPEQPDAEKQFVGRNMRDKFDPDILLQFLVAFNEVQKTETPQYIEYQKNNKNYEARFVPTQNNNILLIIREIPNIKGDINTKPHHTQTNTKAKSELLLNMTQNTQQPIENIITQAENLSANILQPQTAAKATAILKNAVAIHETLTEIWNLARIESGKKLSTRIADPNQIANDIYNIFKISAEEKKLNYTLNINPDLPKLLITDGLKIRQILFNVISNALKFTENGSVDISVTTQNTTNTHTTLVLKVSDTGVGIPQNKVDNILNPEQKNNLSSGMELTTRLIENLNGHIDINTTIGKGSQITITINNIEIYNNNSQQAKEIIDIADTSTDWRKKDQALKQFIVLLKETIIPEYRQLKKNISFDSLSTFVQNFRQQASQYGANEATKMADDIIQSIKDLDINSITTTLRKIEKYFKELTT